MCLLYKFTDLLQRYAESTSPVNFASTAGIEIGIELRISRSGGDCSANSTHNPGPFSSSVVVKIKEHILSKITKFFIRHHFEDRFW